jgi:hypothetical protein
MTVEGTNADLAKLLETVRKQGKQSRFILGVDGLIEPFRKDDLHRAIAAKPRAEADRCKCASSG